MSKKQSDGLLFEMLRSFVALSETLNLTKATKIVSSTRQTIRRHIDYIEMAKGERMFALIGQQYYLTQAGQRSLKAAKEIVARGSGWLSGDLQEVDGLERVEQKDNSGQVYITRQHDLRALWESGTSRLQTGFSCWAQAEFRIDSPEMLGIRPYLVVYRLYKKNWQCVEIGDKSLFSQWLGRDWAKSNVGHHVGSTPASTTFGNVILSEYEEVHFRGGVRLDHIYRVARKEMDGPLLELKFQRLLLGGTFPDGSPAILVLADKTDAIQIAL